MEKNKGILTMGFGNDRYIRMAKSLGRSIRRVDKEVELAVVTDRKNDKFENFDYKIRKKEKFGSGVTQKIYLNEYSPFEETLFIDSDCIVYKKLDKLWDMYGSHGEFVVEVEGYSGRRESYRWIDDIDFALEKLGIERIPLYNGGIYYFSRSEKSDKVFELAREIYKRRRELGIQSFKNSPVPDETVIGLSIEKLGMEMPNFSGECMGKNEYEYEDIIHANVLKGECAYSRYGEILSPVLIHYNVGRQTSYLYLKETYMLESDGKAYGFIKSIITSYIISKYYDFKSRINRANMRAKKIGIMGFLPATMLDKIGIDDFR